MQYLLDDRVLTKFYLPITRLLATASILSAALLFSACGSGPPPKLYLLEAQPRTPPIAVETKRQINAMGISTVVLPGYAGDDRIASLSADGTVSQENEHRWAEDPEVAITRLMSARLRYHAGGSVLIEPWPRDYKPFARVEVVFDRLLREPRGGVDMAGEILLLSSDGRRLLKAMPFEIVHYGRSSDHSFFFLSTAQAIDDIARMVVDALLVLRQKS